MSRCCVQWPSAFALRASARFARAASSVDHCTRVLRLRSPLRELSTAVTSHNAGAALLGYLTDIEGSYDQWRRYVQLSRVLEPDPNDPDNKILLRDGCHFVFGGDAFDRGKGELRFVRELLALRRQYPDRVHLVLGNRDVNKMRLSGELSQRRWVSAANHPALHFSPTSPGDFLKQQGLQDTQPNRLRWMLHETMGCPDTMELRREELSGSADDNEVLASFLATVGSDGEVTEYLQHAKLVVHVGETLIVHGSVGPDAVGVAPMASTESAASANWWPLEYESDLELTEWVRRLNEFAAHEVEQWCADPDGWGFGAADRGGPGFYLRPGGRLLAYAMPKLPGVGHHTQTVISSDYISEQGHIAGISSVTEDFMARGGVSRLLSGHKPNGDTPVVMRGPANLVTAVAADTCYAKFTLWDGEPPTTTLDGPRSPSSSDPRGGAVFEVTAPVDGPGPFSIHGVLDCGAMLDFVCDDALGAAAPGQELGEWWVKGNFPDGDVLLSKGQGLTVTNKKLPLQAALALSIV